MEKYQKILLILVLIFTFLLIYSPHFSYKFPLHVDEWHHLSEARKLQEGSYQKEQSGLEFGFHLFLLILSKISNIILIYKFLPAIFATLTAFILLKIIHKLTNKFLIALFTILFFASIKSNINLTGLWFFTPLTFAIPFIFLYIYLFTEGIEKQNKKFILFSLIIMSLLIITHATSVFFAIPFLIIYSLFNLEKIKKQYKFLSIFLILPIIGIIFYKFLFKQSIRYLLSLIQFKQGWGISELNNSILELYSLIGFILAILGFIYIIKKRKYLIYTIWPIIVLISILIFKLTGTSYFVPFQRNIYYFTLSLPILSSFGLYYLYKRYLTKKYLTILILVLIFFFTFKSYYNLPEQIQPYKTIDIEDYNALLYLSTLEKSKIIATPSVSTAIYPISGHKPIATTVFYGNKQDTEQFFFSKDCETKQDILNKYNIKYVLSKWRINCGWNQIYNKNNFIYEVKWN